MVVLLCMFFTVFCVANFGRLSTVSKMTNMAARPDLIGVVAAIPVTVSEVFDDSLNKLGKRGLGGCYQVN